MSNLRTHAENELRAIGMLRSSDEMSKTMSDDILQIVDVFSAQGHSGFSAGYAIGVLTKLLRFEPLGPLTGVDEEWTDLGGGLFQNKRCSHVFKENGVAYDINGIVWRDPDGATFTNFESRVPVTFPYTPTSEIRDRA